MKSKQTNISIFFKGDSTRQPVIFVHGFPFDHHMWDKLTEAISEDFFCVTYDIRGLGKSPAGDGQFTMELFSDDLLNIIDELNLNKPVLAGLSMGGYISLRTVERKENIFKALILLDTKAEADNNQAKLKRAQGINIINQKGLDAFLNEFIPTCFAEESILRLGKEYEDVFERSMQNDPAGVKGCLLAMAGRTDTTEYLSKINVPALVICGEKDALSPPPVMKEMQSKIKNSRFVLVPGSGHMTPIEQPEKTIDEIKKFLAKL